MASTKLFWLTFALISLLEFIKTDYIAAVVEYQPINGTSPNETIALNLAQYIYYVEQASQKSVQIIVFPEYGLTGLVPEPSGYAIEIPNPGDNTIFSEHLQTLSNCAVAHSMYVVANLLEKEIDKTNNTVYYNTNVVFDKYGKLVAKHRKINLYRESALTPGNPAQNQNIFATDFGVTFGMFTCADITYFNPGKTILSDPSVTDIVFPTAWSSFVPFFHSLSIQSGYAVSNKVNLLAANHNNVANGIGGSGIYGADGSVFSYYISGSPGTKLQIATVKIAPTRENTNFTTYGFDILDENIPALTDFKAKRQFDSEKYEFTRLNLSQLTIEKEVCYNNFCCFFKVNVSATALNSSEIYQIMAYKGPIMVGEVRNVKLCSIIACESSDLSTCGNTNIKLTSTFESVSVETNIPDEPEGYYLPFSLTGNLLPIFDTAFNSTVKNGVRTSKYWASNIKQQNIIAFGIAGNNGVTYSLNFVLSVIILGFYVLY